MGRRLIYDLESDGLLDSVSRIWCIGTKDIDTGEERLFTPMEIEEGLQYLKSADLLVAHNGTRYDNEVIKKLHNVDLHDKTIDTLIMSKIHWPFMTPIKGAKTGAYSLKSFGIRFKFPKGDYDDWSQYTPEMGEYCLQDCRVTLKIWEKLLSKGYEWDSEWNRIEHDFARVQQKAVNRGVWFDEDLQRKTLLEIDTRMNEIQQSVEDVLGYAYQDFDYTLLAEVTKSNPTPRTLEERLPIHAKNKMANAKLEFPWYDKPYYYNKSKTKVRVKYPVKITLDTKKLLIEKLQELGWKPEFYTDPSETHPNGQPQLVRDGEVDPNLVNMGDEYKEFSEYFMLKHRLGLIHGLTKLLRPDGRIPADADTVGTVTGRVSHKGVANFPRVSTPYGKVIRAMFGVQPNSNRTLIGSDLAGIEARLLAHFMNDAEFTDFISGVDENGEPNDVHTYNIGAVYKLVGIKIDRNGSKTFYYALVYGAGDPKMGSVIGGSAKEGKALKEGYFGMFPGLLATKERMEEEGKNGYVRILGDRIVKLTRSRGFDGEMQYDTRKALNSLLQGSGAIYFKKWAVEVDKRLREGDVITILYHDEIEIDCDENNVEYNKQVLQTAVEETDKYFKVNCPNAIDTKVGTTWADVH
jgi:DNA polymerase-1